MPELLGLKDEKEVSESDMLNIVTEAEMKFGIKYPTEKTTKEAHETHEAEAKECDWCLFESARLNFYPNRSYVAWAPFNPTELQGEGMVIYGSKDEGTLYGVVTTGEKHGLQEKQYKEVLDSPSNLDENIVEIITQSKI